MTSLGPDSRLRPLIEELAGGRYKVLSLDVFDTLLWRRVPEPIDMFYRVGRVLIDGDFLAQSVAVSQFAHLRAAAEKAARARVEAKTGSREVLLADIYAELPEHIWQSQGKTDLAASIEVSTEAESMVLDHDVVAVMDAAISAGVRVVLTSDTYFTRDELTGFLVDAGLPADRIPEKLYISNEQGKPKWRDLFDYVLADLSVALEHVVHVGDNVDADVAPCVARDIVHVFYDKWGGLPRTRDRELPKEVANRGNWIMAGGDAGLTGLRSRLANRAPVDLPDDHRPYWTYGATTLAPLFAAYASWVVGTVASQKGSGVLGIMREGRFLARLVSHVSQALGQEVNPGEVWLSRRAVVRAALWPDDLSMLAQAVSYCPGPTSDDVLAQLGLSRADLAGVFKDPNLFDIHATGGMEAFLTGVSRSEDLQNKLTQFSANRRQKLLLYLEGALSTKKGIPTFLLDLGYAGTIQTVLQKILEREGVGHSLVGLYVAVNTKGRDNALAGTDLRALIDRDGYDSGLTRLLERTPDILEHACMCPEGSLDDIGEDGQPDLLPSQRPASQIAQMEAMQEGILAGAGSILELLGQGCVKTTAFVDHASEIVKQSMLYPTPAEVATVGSWLHEANFDLSDQRALADLRVDPAHLEFGGAAAWSSLARHEAYWPQAALAKLNPAFAGAASAVADNKIEVVSLSSGSALGVLTLVSDIGVGVDDRKSMHVPLEVSALGRGEIQAEIKPFGPEAYQVLHMQWPNAKAVVVVERCAVRYRGESEQSVIDITSKLSIDGGTHEGPIMVGETGASITFELGSTLPPWPHGLDLLLRFTYVRLDRIF
ncbi:MAG: hypothetical protein GKS03_14300 [Alphaproteobacteria bacterium]|nr:hypothetical protein [Alphaproteobacteria bacterium]